MDLDMFQVSSDDNISLLTKVLADFIAKLIDDIIPVVTVKAFSI